MRKRDFVIFFSIVLSLYGLINFYIFISGWEAIPAYSPLRIWYGFVFGLLSLSFIAGRFLERVRLSWTSSALVWAGSFWLAGMVYFLLAVATIDLFRLVNNVFSIFPSFITSSYEQTKLVAMLIVSIAVALIVFGGYLNAHLPQIKKLDIALPKKAGTLTALNIVVASDIHLGTIICKSRLEQIVRKINALQPDIVLLPGDVVDEDIGPVIKQNLGETLRRIESRYGVIAVTGNHEYIGGVEAACSYLAEHGITMLRDGTIKINDSLYVVGREDRSFNRTGVRKRKSLEELLAGIDMRLPVILMDHQPFGLDEAMHGGVDLQLSGHTHHGQLWPFNYITRKIYEVSWGYKRKGNTHVYVSCGVGTWGPPVRTGNKPEIIQLRLTFNMAHAQAR